MKITMILEKHWCSLSIHQKIILVLGAFYDCTNVLKDIQALKPQVILMDIEMPERNGIEAMQLIRGIDKEVKIIMLTVFDDNKNVLAAIGAGASGYLLKKNSFEKLFDAIEEVMHGGAPMSANVARLVFEYVAPMLHLQMKNLILLQEKKKY